MEYEFWEVEKIGIMILCGCCIIVIINRICSCQRKEACARKQERIFIRHIPDRIEKLESMTKFSRSEIRSLYRNFKNECPSGIIYEDTFKKIFSSFFPDGESSRYANHVFRAFGGGRKGHLTFQDFIIRLSLILHGSLDDRIRWTFQLYDTNQDGFVCIKDVQEICKSIYTLLGNYTHEPITEEEEEIRSNQVFNKLSSGEELITCEDFQKACHQDSDICNSFNIFQQEMLVL